MCYLILTHTSKIISRSMVHHVKNIELYTDEVKETFVGIDAEINHRSTSDNHEYEGSKLIPQDWTYLLEEDPEFSEDFKRVFNNDYILEQDGFTADVLENTYVDMDK